MAKLFINSSNRILSQWSKIESFKSFFMVKVCNFMMLLKCEVLFKVLEIVFLKLFYMLAAKPNFAGEHGECVKMFTIIFLFRMLIDLLNLQTKPFHYSKACGFSREAYEALEKWWKQKSPAKAGLVQIILKLNSINWGILSIPWRKMLSNEVARVIVRSVPNLQWMELAFWTFCRAWNFQWFSAESENRT